MRPLDLPAPVRMQRIAIATPTARLRDLLVQLAARGDVELAGELPPPHGAASDALGRLGHATPADRVTPSVTPAAPDVRTLEQRGARDLLAGEVELARRAATALTQEDVAVFLGWTAAPNVAELRHALGDQGAAVVELPAPPELPPTLLRRTGLTGPFRVLVDTYGVLPYSDVDPTAFAAIAFVVMFGMMFGDAGQGALLTAVGAALSRVRGGRLVAFRPAWPLVTTAGVSATLFGLLYGEFFGPTGLVPTLWLAPLEQPLVLLRAGIVVGSVLLSVSYILGAANRWRERGPGAALFAEGGAAGGLVFAGAAVGAWGWARHTEAATVAGVATALAGVGLVFVGALTQAGGGVAGVMRAAIEVLDTAIRIGSNVVSFTRLAAFGLTHAALSVVTLQAAQRLATEGPLGVVAAGVVFVAGTLIAITLEGMVAGIQALRLEYYELFSRMLEEEGRPFAPFAMAVRAPEAPV